MIISMQTSNKPVLELGLVLTLKHTGCTPEFVTIVRMVFTIYNVRRAILQYGSIFAVFTSVLTHKPIPMLQSCHIASYYIKCQEQ